MPFFSPLRDKRHICHARKHLSYLFFDNGVNSVILFSRSSFYYARNKKKHKTKTRLWQVARVLLQRKFLSELKLDVWSNRLQIPYIIYLATKEKMSVAVPFSPQQCNSLTMCIRALAGDPSESQLANEHSQWSRSISYGFQRTMNDLFKTLESTGPQYKHRHIKM